MSSKINLIKSNLYSIGDVSTFTGISVFTLRMWERRYGSPVSEKLPSGHRRFRSTEISRLKLVKQAVDLGLKPSFIVSKPEPELEPLVQKALNELSNLKTDPRIASDLIGHMVNWNEAKLLQSFEDDWESLGAHAFIEDRLGPLLFEMGLAWKRGDLPIAAEHFASGVIENFLQSKWRTANANLSGRYFILSSFTGETHALGIHMCAATLVALGHHVVYLGASMPKEEILRTSKSKGCQAVCLSISKFSSTFETTQNVKWLRKNIASEIPIVVGGQGAPNSIKNVMTFKKWQEFHVWLDNNFEKNEVSGL